MIPADFQKYIRSKEFKQLLAKYKRACEEDESEYFDADDLLDIAEYYHVKDNEEAALKVIDYMLELFPGQEKGLVFKARSAILAGDVDKAEAISNIIEEPEIADTYYLRGEILLCRGKAKEADAYLREQYAKIDEDAPIESEYHDPTGLFPDEEEEEDSPAVQRNDFALDLALLMCDYQQWDYARGWLNEVNDTKLFTDPDYLEVNARILTATGEFKQAIIQWNAYIDQDAYSALAWIQLAQCQYHLGLCHEALQSAQYAEAIAPEMPEVYLSQGNCYFSMGDSAIALEYFSKFLKLCPGDIQGETLMASVYFSIEKYDEANDHIQNAVFALDMYDDRSDAIPDIVRVEVYRQAAYIAAARGHAEEADFYADRMHDCGIDEVKCILLKAGVLLECGRLKEAFNVFNEALRAANHEPETYVTVGCMLIDANAYELGYKVLNDILRVLEEDGMEQEVGYERLAYAAYQLGKRDEFVRALTIAVKKNPSDTVTIFSTVFPKDTLLREYVECAKTIPLHSQAEE